jgi:hypothetical protein
MTVLQGRIARSLLSKDITSSPFSRRGSFVFGVAVYSNPVDDSSILFGILEILDLNSVHQHLPSFITLRRDSYPKAIVDLTSVNGWEYPSLLLKYPFLLDYLIDDRHALWNHGG